jgi:hypothetical protein
MGPDGAGNQDDSTGEGQQQFTGLVQYGAWVRISSEILWIIHIFAFYEHWLVVMDVPGSDIGSCDYGLSLFSSVLEANAR